MPKHSAGLLMFRRRGDGLHVLLVHPGGPFWKNKDLGAWTIPKGEHDAGEEALLARGGDERLLARVVLSLGNGPGAEVFVLPERAARMDEQHLKLAAAATEHEQTGALLRHVVILPVNLRRAVAAGSLYSGLGLCKAFQDQQRGEGPCAGETCEAAATWRTASPPLRAASAADSSWGESD